MANGLGQQFTDTARLLREVIPSSSRAALEEKELDWRIQKTQEEQDIRREKLGMERERHDIQMAGLKEQRAEIERQKVTPFHLPTSDLLAKASLSQKAWISDKLEALQTIFGPDATYNFETGNIDNLDPKTNQMTPISEYEFNLKAPQIATALGMVTDGYKILEDAAQRGDARAKQILAGLQTDEAKLAYYQKMLATKHGLFSRLMGSGQIPREYIQLAKEGIKHTAGKINTLQDRIKTRTTEESKRQWEMQKITKQGQQNWLLQTADDLRRTKADYEKQNIELKAKIASGVYEVEKDEPPVNLLEEWPKYEAGDYDERPIKKAQVLKAKVMRDIDQSISEQNLTKIGEIDARLEEIKARLGFKPLALAKPPEVEGVAPPYEREAIPTAITGDEIQPEPTSVSKDDVNSFADRLITNYRANPDETQPYIDRFNQEFGGPEYKNIRDRLNREVGRKILGIKVDKKGNTYRVKDVPSLAWSFIKKLGMPDTARERVNQATERFVKKTEGTKPYVIDFPSFKEIMRELGIVKDWTVEEFNKFMELPLPIEKPTQQALPTEKGAF